MMKIYISIFIIVILTFFTSCGEKEEVIQSRASLSSSIRQINAYYRDFRDNQPSEERLTLIRTREYYSDYTRQLRDIRNNLAGYSITPKYEPIRELTDSVITNSIDFINHRQSLMLNLFELTSNVSRYRDYLEYYDRYERESSRYSRRRALEYKLKALEKSMEFIINRSTFSMNLLVYKNNIERLVDLSDSLNSILLLNNFTDTLNFRQTIEDTTSVIHRVWDSVKDLELEIPD